MLYKYDIFAFEEKKIRITLKKNICCTKRRDISDRKKGHILKKRGTNKKKKGDIFFKKKFLDFMEKMNILSRNDYTYIF